MRVAVALIGLEVELHPEHLARFVDERIGVARIAVHLAPGARYASIAHQIGDLMRALGREGPEVPLHVVVAQTVIGAALLAADEALEFQRVAHEEDGGVVAHHVEVAFLGIHLHREAARVAPCVGAAALACDGREARDDVGLRARLEHFRLGVFRDVARHGEMAERARALGVGLALRDALPVEIRHLLDEVVIVQNDRTVGTDRERMFETLDGGAPVCGGGASALVVRHVGTSDFGKYRFGNAGGVAQFLEVSTTEFTAPICWSKCVRPSRSGP